MFVAGFCLGAQAQTTKKDAPLTDSVKKIINSRQFKMMSVADGDSFISVISTRSYIQFNLDSMNITGSDGCNGFFGKIVSIGKSSVKFGPTMGTMMFCEAVNNTDNKIKAALQLVNRYELKGNAILRLYEGEKLLISCGPVKPARRKR